MEQRHLRRGLVLPVYDPWYLAPFVVVIAIALVALGITGAFVCLGVVLVSRHQSRTRDQRSTVFALQMAVVAMVVAARQRFDAAVQNGQWAEVGSAGTPWVATDTKVRPTVVRQMALVEDVQLKELTTRLLDRTRQLLTTADAREAARLQHEIEGLRARFQARTTEVVRALAVGRLSRPR